MQILTNMRKLLLMGFLLLMVFQNSYSQKFVKLSDVVQGLKPTLTVSLKTPEIDFLNPMAFGFTTQGIVAISKDRTSLVCYRPDGSIAWTRQPPEKVISAIHVSDDGEIIAAYYPLSEDEGVTEVMTSDGSVLWRNVFEAAFEPSPTGKYLYSGPSALSGMPLTVIETKTGKVLWKENVSDFIAELLDEEHIVHVSREDIKLIEMRTGNILTERNISKPFKNELSYTNWEIAVSKDGSYITLLGRSSKSLRVFVVTYNHNLKPVWSNYLEPGYPTLVGISEDGSKLCIDRLKTIKLYNNFTGNLLWQVKDKILNNGAIVTNKFIAIKQADYESEVFVLGEDGSLRNRFKSNSIFIQTKIPKFGINKETVNLLTSTIKEWGSIVEIKKENVRYSAIFYVK